MTSNITNSLVSFEKSACGFSTRLPKPLLLQAFPSFEKMSLPFHSMESLLPFHSMESLLSLLEKFFAKGLLESCLLNKSVTNFHLFLRTSTDFCSYFHDVFSKFILIHFATGLYFVSGWASGFICNPNSLQVPQDIVGPYFVEWSWKLGRLKSTSSLLVSFETA